jgi:hypothetical protein
MQPSDLIDGKRNDSSNPGTPAQPATPAPVEPVRQPTDRTAVSTPKPKRTTRRRKPFAL